MTDKAMRRPRRAVNIAGVTLGGGRPVVVQSMTDTDTVDVRATVQQVRELAQAGSELVRITVNTEEAAAAVPLIRDQLDALSVSVPLVGDFHYNGHRLLTDYPACAQALAKYRINPGNVGFGGKWDKQFSMMIEAALRYDRPVRIGANWGSLDQALLTRLMNENSARDQPLSAVAVMHDALVRSVLDSAGRAVQLGLSADKIVLSCKVSGVQSLIEIYRRLALECDYALHLGLTEAGMGSKGIVASAAALAVLLQEGVGDTIRISITPEPGQSRTHEVVVAQELLQNMGFRAFTPQVTACPGCGRTSGPQFQELAAKVSRFVRERMPEWRACYPGVEGLKLAVMGCVVNGPGESRHADIGISLPGRGEGQVMPVFIDGQKTHTLRGDNIADRFLELIEEYVERRYGGGDKS